MSNENLYTKDCIRTYTGIYMNVFEPTEEMICIEDIAHSLSFMPRFAGHLPKFYSVAQHCILSSYFVKNELKMAALLHDASEAYLMDMPKPIKERMPIYQEIEANLMTVIARKFGFAYPLHPDVKTSDKTMLEWEWKRLMLNEKGSVLLKPLTSEGSEDEFLFHFKNYLLINLWS